MTSDSTTAEKGLDVTVDEPGAWKRRLTVIVPEARVQEERGRVRSRLAKQLDLDGFRQGKVPPQIVEQRFGPTIDDQTVQSLVSETLREAFRQEEIEPIGDPEISDIGFLADDRLRYEIEVEIMPRIELDRVGGFRVEQPATEVDPDEVDEVLDRLREDEATWRPAEREPREGDMVTVRIRPADREEELSSDDEYQFEMGDGNALPDIEDAISTLEPGERETFDVHFPEALREEGQAEDRELEIELRDVKEAELPPLDDELASRVGDFESLEELREAVREDVEAHHRDEAENEVRERLMDHVIEANPFEVPESMVEDYMDRMLDAPDDVDPEELEQARQQVRPRAERQIKRHLIIERLTEREGLEATEDEVDERIREIADAEGLEPGAVRRQLARDDRMESLRRQISAEKAFDYLKEQSSVE
ncbi:MAG: trigger factor [Candidatus Palauibacterales bacterium]|nr:trigger factor [Candidatus Palauibacterales bacterium]